MVNINLRNDVYDAINLWKSNNYNSSLEEHAIKVYEIYKVNGGTCSFSYFEDTLNEYLYNGYCGY